MTLILAGGYAQLSDLPTAAEFDRLTGTPQTLVHVSFPLQNGPQYTPFPVVLLSALWVKNQITMVTVGTWDYLSGHAWTWADIVSGKYDAPLHAWAQAAAALKHPFFLRLDHEMNQPSSNLPYTTLASADPAGFVAAWQHIVDLFRSDGATNVTWVWCINSVTPAGMGKPSDADRVGALYPGDQYVDWLGFDVYNWGGSKGPTMPWLSWQQIVSGFSNWIGDTYSTLTALAPGKPIVVGETGCHTTGGPTGKTPNGDKTAWVLDFLTTTPTLYPAIGALSWFQRNYTPSGPMWALDGYDGQAWKQGVSGPAYVQPGFLMPPDGQPIQPYRLAAISGSPLTGPDQAALLNQAHAETAAAVNSQTVLEGLVRARKAAGAAEDAAVD